MKFAILALIAVAYAQDDEEGGEAEAATCGEDEAVCEEGQCCGSNGEGEDAYDGCGASDATENDDGEPFACNEVAGDEGAGSSLAVGAAAVLSAAYLLA